MNRSIEEERNEADKKLLACKKPEGTKYECRKESCFSEKNEAILFFHGEVHTVVYTRVNYSTLSTVGTVSRVVVS